MFGVGLAGEPYLVNNGRVYQFVWNVDLFLCAYYAYSSRRKSRSSPGPEKEYLDGNYRASGTGADSSVSLHYLCSLWHCAVQGLVVFLPVRSFWVQYSG